MQMRLGWREPPFVGMQRDLEDLLREARSPDPSRWLLLGERGMGKTRLAHELVRRVGRDSHFLSLSSGNLGSYELASSLMGLPSDTALIVFDDVDEVSVNQPAFVNDLLLNLPTATVVMTAAVEKLHPSWEPIAGAGSGTVTSLSEDSLPQEPRPACCCRGSGQPERNGHWNRDGKPEAHP